MNRLIVLAMVIGLLMSGCVNERIYRQTPYSTNDIPLELRKPPTQYVNLIKKDDPQPDPSSYIVLGRISSKNDNITVFEKRSMGALNLLKEEAMRMGANAIIKIEISESNFGSTASGWAIRFKDPDERNSQ